MWTTLVTIYARHPVSSSQSRALISVLKPGLQLLQLLESVVDLKDTTSFVPEPWYVLRR